MTSAEDGEEGQTNGESGLGEAEEGFEAVIGKTRWELPGGYVPVESTGPEPEMVSHDKLCLLNASDEMATLELTLYYMNGHEAGPYPLTVSSQRVRHVRINDLIDPYAPPLGKAYSIVVESPVPVVVQLTRQDSRQDELATMSSIGYGESRN